MCSPSQGPCCTPECSLKYGDKCRDDNGCRDPSYCDGRMPHCPPSVNKPNKTICNKEFVCFMGVSCNVTPLIRTTMDFTIFLTIYRNAPDQSASPTDSSRVSASPAPAIRKQNPANCAAKFLAKEIIAKVRSNGTKRRMMSLTCSLSPARRAMTTSGTATSSRNAARLTRQDL